MIEVQDARHFKNLFLRFFSWTERPTDSKLSWKYRENIEKKKKKKKVKSLWLETQAGHHLKKLLLNGNAFQDGG